MQRTRIGITLAALLLVAVGARANPASDALRRRASNELFNLDDEQALATWRAATEADPQDGAAWRGLASTILVRVAMMRGVMTGESYLGRVQTSDIAAASLPADLIREFNTAVAHAITLGRQRVAAHPRDAEAQYQFGAALGIRASYTALVEGSMMGAVRSARDAFDADETALKLDPSRADAGLIAGTYRYLVASLSLPMRWAAYMAGFGGGRALGLRLVEGAATYPGDNQSEARLALVLLYSREQRFDEALQQITQLETRYPRNRLLWLEAGATLLRAKRPDEAERAFDRGLSMLAHDTRTRMYGEESLWSTRRGAARMALGRTAEASTDLNRSLALEGRAWVHARTHLELGRLALQTSNAPLAREHLLAAATLADSDRDSACSERARELLRHGLPSH